LRSFLKPSDEVGKPALQIAEDIIVPISNDGDIFSGKP
jgi:hypothetical protein